MACVEKITHKGKEIIFIDYENSENEEAMIAVLKQAQRIIIEDNKPYLQLTNMTNAFATPGFMKEVKQIAKETPKIAIKRAIVGISSPGKRILLQAYNMVLGTKNSLRPFETMEEALDWLVAD